jgi:hypothetical protein
MFFYSRQPFYWKREGKGRKMQPVVTVRQVPGS